MDKSLGPPVVPFYLFLGEGFPTKIDYRKRGTLIEASLLEDLGGVAIPIRIAAFCQASGVQHFNIELRIEGSSPRQTDMGHAYL